MNAKSAPGLGRQTIDDFLDEFLVACPRCGRQAVVRPSAGAVPPRLTCTSCGVAREWHSEAKGVLVSHASRTWPEGQFAIGDGADPYFHLPLWLRADCGGNLLWAFNPRHLRAIRDYVAAADRSLPPGPAGGPVNTTLASRLPRWMKLARNRALVLHTIEQIEARG